ncbi:hypothetical protein ACET3Z_010371 [Daucus carota]
MRGFPENGKISIESSDLAFPPLYCYNGGVQDFLATIKKHVHLVRNQEQFCRSWSSSWFCFTRASSFRILCINPLKETELILYGGEFYNGNKTYVYGDLYRYDVDKNEWKLISSPNSPPPRSAHQAVAWKNYLYIYEQFCNLLCMNWVFPLGSLIRNVQAQELLKNEIRVILGPQTTPETNFVVELGAKSQVPIVSFSATSSYLSHVRSPYFIQMAGADSSQLKAIASIFKGFGWKEVIFVYEDTGYQDGLIQYLSDAMREAGIQISMSSAISISANDLQIEEELLKLKSASSRVFLVHMAPPLGS